MIKILKEEQITTNQDTISFTEKQKRILIYALENIDSTLNGTNPSVPKGITYGDIKEVYNKLK